MVYIDEYRISTCSITDEICYGDDCSSCKECLNEEHGNRIREHTRLSPTITGNKDGITFLFNEYQTVAEFGSEWKIDEAISAVKVPDGDETPVPYDINRLIVRWPHFVKVKNIMSLGVPLKLMEISNHLFAYYEDTFYLASPKWTDEEFNDIR